MQEAYILKTWTQAVEDNDSDIADNLDEEEYGLENEEFELEHGGTQMIDDPTEEFVPCVDV